MFNTIYIDVKVYTHVYIGIERERHEQCHRCATYTERQGGPGTCLIPSISISKCMYTHVYIGIEGEGHEQ